MLSGPGLGTPCQLRRVRSGAVDVLQGVFCVQITIYEISYLKQLIYYTRYKSQIRADSRSLACAMVRFYCLYFEAWLLPGLRISNSSVLNFCTNYYDKRNQPLAPLKMTINTYVITHACMLGCHQQYNYSLV
jgi:hypothetical protein